MEVVDGLFSLLEYADQRAHVSISVSCPCEGESTVGAHLVFDPKVLADMVLHVAQLLVLLTTGCALVQFTSHSRFQLNDVLQNLLSEIFFRNDGVRTSSAQIGTYVSCILNNDHWPCHLGSNS